eukprot:TRINITY_DN18212_c0_g1_i1.p2 TRINITY_DN18212_c0_g1~~TRINITY_DN18212_c0_g1_i1.p2  ORF type:complete len:114 (-),score=39.10 TRINITY_DN18212_c0_g1_i1:51-392(-)
MASGYNWSWPQIPSLTAMKYQRHGYVESKPFLPGERKNARDGLERHVKGYRELKTDLEKIRKDILNTQTLPQGGPVIKVGYYKSVVGTRTIKSGGFYKSTAVSRVGFFTHSTN